MANPLTSLLNRWTIPSVGENESKNYFYVKTKEGINYGTKEALEVKKASSEASVFKKMSKELLASRQDIKTVHEQKLTEVSILASIKHDRYTHKHSKIYLFFFGGAEKKAYNALNRQINSMLQVVAQQKNILDLSARYNQAEAKVAALIADSVRLTAISESDDPNDVVTLKEMSELRMLIKVHAENKKDPKSTALTKEELAKMKELWQKVPHKPKGAIQPEDAVLIVQARMDELEKKAEDVINADNDLDTVLDSLIEEKKLVAQLKIDLEKAIRKEV